MALRLNDFQKRNMYLTVSMMHPVLAHANLAPVPTPSNTEQIK